MSVAEKISGAFNTVGDAVTAVQSGVDTVKDSFVQIVR